MARGWLDAARYADTHGLHPGQMVIIAARPGLGKSTLGLDFARNASIKHGMTSAIFSLEMSRNEIVMRLLSAEAQVALHHMRSGSMGEQDWHKLAAKMGALLDAKLENEYPAAVAGLDIPGARIYGKKLNDSIRAEIQSWAHLWP